MPTPPLSSQYYASFLSTGFVPNYAAGTYISYDRTEPQIGAYVVRELFRRFNDTWFVDATFDSLLSWNDWVWNKRRG